MAHETAKISEFIQNEISIFDPANRENGLLIKTTSDPHILSIQCKNQKYSCTHKQAHMYIINAFDLSVYNAPHWIYISIPFYPMIKIPLSTLWVYLI